MELVQKYEAIIPTITYQKGDKYVDEFDSIDCTICMEEFRDGERLRKLTTCGHLFHPSCILRWLQGEQQRLSQKCPLCNMALSVGELRRANQEFFEKSPDKHTPAKAAPNPEEEEDYATQSYSTTSKITLMHKQVR